MPPVGFEPTFSAGERPQTYALDRAATGTGIGLLKYAIQIECQILFRYRWILDTLGNFLKNAVQITNPVKICE